MSELVALPAAVQEILSRERPIERVAKKYAGARDFLYLGRGVNYPVALEGAASLRVLLSCSARRSVVMSTCLPSGCYAPREPMVP